MTIAFPAYAAVRPRVVVKSTGESRLLEEVIEEIAGESSTRVVCISGSGKSTALAHLAAVFVENGRIAFLDEPTPQELAHCGDNRLIVTTIPGSERHGIDLELESWKLDEHIEYLLAKHHDVCGMVIERLGSAANWTLSPQVACIILDSFAADESLSDPSQALLRYVDNLLSTPNQRAAAEQFCLTLLVGKARAIERAAAELSTTENWSELWKLLKNKLVMHTLAARRLVNSIANDKFAEFERPLPFELVKLVGMQCRGNARLVERLSKLLAKLPATEAHAMAASILLVCDPEWRPIARHRSWYLTQGYFRNAQWSEVDVSAGYISSCDFAEANLDGASLEGATASNSSFYGASLRGADLRRITATRASFRRANLERANLSNGRFTEADFTEANLAKAALMAAHLSNANLSAALLCGADLTGADLRGANLEDADLSDCVLIRANLSGVDLRSARLHGTCMEQAILTNALLEDVCIPQARLRDADLCGAHLTGSSFPRADLRDARLCGAGLAEIEWEGADLRGADLRRATFHMGSSRSGLVGSPIACEGSKTGFYTNDLEDMTFKRPEEVRKANLRGADLRGVKAANVDFYLVDLRDAKMDSRLREQALQTGAIIADSAA